MNASAVHLEALTVVQRRILQACSKPTQAWGAYLAGGAAIALNFGHRRSDDFDWFGPRAVPPAELLKDVRTLGRSIEVDQNNEGTFLGHVDGVKFSVFRYRYPLLAAILVQRLDGDLALHDRVHRAIDLSHPATANESPDDETALGTDPRVGSQYFHATSPLPDMSKRNSARSGASSG